MTPGHAALKRGIVLFAHWSRDPEWAHPFQKIRAVVVGARPECEVRLAYLDHMSPSLPEALADLKSSRVTNVQIVPLFFGLGGHLKEDLPRLAADRRAAGGYRSHRRGYCARRASIAVTARICAPSRVAYCGPV
jgi:sirohydrochlorin cobaltochelatase